MVTVMENGMHEQMSCDAIRQMIRELAAEAKRQNGKLTDLALPEAMYRDFFVFNGGYLPEITKEFFFEGVRIHTGEDD